MFRAMFYGPIKEKGDVKMGDASAAGFVEFLQFFYSNRVKLTVEIIGEVMSFGDKYDVAEYVNLCVHFLMKNLTAHNVFHVHGLASLFQQNDLKFICDHIIGFQTEEVLQSPSFLACERPKYYSFDFPYKTLEKSNLLRYLHNI